MVTFISAAFLGFMVFIQSGLFHDLDKKVKLIFNSPHLNLLYVELLESLKTYLCMKVVSKFVFVEVYN